MNTKETIDAILAETGKAVLGKDDVLRRILTAILADDHGRRLHPHARA